MPRGAASSVVHPAAIMVVFHSLLMMLVMLPVFAVFSSMLSMLVALVLEKVHPVPVKMKLEQIQFDFCFMLGAGTRRSHVW